MADVRSLLRQTNAARSNEAAASAGKKRKATSTLAQSPGRKKPKSGPVTPAVVGIVEEESVDQSSVSLAKEAHDDERDNSAAHEAELAALDRDLALMDAAASTTSTIAAAPAVSAPPMSAEDIAAQARVEQSEQRGRRDVELEAEREDAARALEDEFEAMDEFEERAKRFRERREALRKANTTEKLEGSEAGTNQRVLSPTHADAERTTIPDTNTGVDDDEDDEDEDEDEEDDDFADWNFGTKA